MCLLVMVSQQSEEQALVVAANRDERMDRPAVAMTVLQDAGPRILGGRDQLAGGTWLAVNEHGVVAGLTNTPMPDGRDTTKRSRGALPLLAARHRSASQAVDALIAEVRPTEFNPAWMLVGDRSSLFAVTIAGDRPAVTALPQGTHVVENRPPGQASPKAEHVREMLARCPRNLAGDGLRRALQLVLADHRPPSTGEDDDRQPEVLAACVHIDGYGTRSSAVITVPGDPSQLPSLAVADGPPCRAPFGDVTHLWGATATSSDGRPPAR